ILVTCAVEAEFAPWHKLRHFATRSVGDLTVFEAQVGRAVVDFVVTGMGIDNAMRSTSAILTQAHSFCIAAGFAGSLHRKLCLGSIVVADAVQLLGKSTTLSGSRGLAHNAQQDGAFRAKLLLTSDHVVRTPDEKAQLAPFAEFVDMESFGVFQAAHKVGRPAVAIRVISDGHDAEIPKGVELTIDQRGRILFGKVVRYVSRYPIHLPALIRLGRNSRTAAQALAAFLEAYVKKISFLTHGWFPEGQNLEQVASR